MDGDARAALTVSTSGTRVAFELSRLQALRCAGETRVEAHHALRSRRPPKPATSASHVPPLEATWMPSAVLPWTSRRFRLARRHEVLDRVWIPGVQATAIARLIAMLDKAGMR